MLSHSFLEGGKISYGDYYSCGSRNFFMCIRNVLNLQQTTTLFIYCMRTTIWNWIWQVSQASSFEDLFVVGCWQGTISHTYLEGTKVFFPINFVTDSENMWIEKTSQSESYLLLTTCVASALTYWALLVSHQSNDLWAYPFLLFLNWTFFILFLSCS